MSVQATTLRGCTPASPAESMQRAFAASELAIPDVRPFSDLTRLRAAAWRGTVGVQTSRMLYRHYALSQRVNEAWLQRKHAYSDAHYVDYGESCMHFRQSNDPVCPPKDRVWSVRSEACGGIVLAGFTSAGTRSELPCIVRVLKAPWYGSMHAFSLQPWSVPSHVTRHFCDELASHNLSERLCAFALL